MNRYKTKTYVTFVNMFIPELARIMTDFLVPDATGMNDVDLAESDFVELHQLIENPDAGMHVACKSGNMALVQQMANRGVNSWDCYLTLACVNHHAHLGSFLISSGAVECWLCGPDNCRTFGRLIKR